MPCVAEEAIEKIFTDHFENTHRSNDLKDWFASFLTLSSQKQVFIVGSHPFSIAVHVADLSRFKVSTAIMFMDNIVPTEYETLGGPTARLGEVCVFISFSLHGHQLFSPLSPPPHELIWPTLAQGRYDEKERIFFHRHLMFTTLKDGELDHQIVYIWDPTIKTIVSRQEPVRQRYDFLSDGKCVILFCF